MEVSKDALLLSGVCDSSTVYQVCMLCLHVRESEEGGAVIISALCLQVLTSDFLPLTERMIEEERAELHSIEVHVGVLYSTLERV